MDKMFPLRLFTIAALLVLTNGYAAAQPGGGKTSDSAATKPKPAKPAKTSSSTTRTNTRSTSSNSAKPANRLSSTPASIDGKWWTSGNDFGASEVIFTQSGASVSGVIHYTDGRTGTLNGTLVGKRLQHTWTNSSGDSGSGWLELSWNNFLGGPWHNQKVRDGSWTLMRVGGKWCFQGSRTRIRTVTHNARGEISMVAEDGDQEGGYLEGPWVYLESDGQTIKGDFDFRANRVNWSSGFYWTWCGRN